MRRIRDVCVFRVNDLEVFLLQDCIFFCVTLQYVNICTKMLKKRLVYTDGFYDYHLQPNDTFRLSLSHAFRAALEGKENLFVDDNKIVKKLNESYSEYETVYDYYTEDGKVYTESHLDIRPLPAPYKEIEGKPITSLAFLFKGCRRDYDLSLFDFSNIVDIHGMFYNFKGHCLYEFPNSKINTANIKDMSRLFEGAENLCNIDMTLFDTQNVVDMSNMFKGCKTLKQIIFSHLETGNVKDMSYMFEGCQNMEEFDVDRFDTGNVVSFKGMFKDCTSARKIDVSHFCTKNCEDMSSMFSGCSSLNYVDITHFITRKTTNLAGMFAGCKSMQEVDLSHIETCNVTNFSGMFSGCCSIRTIDINNFDTRKATSMSCMFSGCELLKTIHIQNIDTSNVEYMHGMFSNCLSLEKLDLSNFNTMSLKDMSSMFQDCSMLKGLDLSSFHVSDEVSVENAFSGMIYRGYLSCELCFRTDELFAAESGWSKDGI